MYSLHHVAAWAIGICRVQLQTDSECTVELLQELWTNNGSTLCNPFPVALPVSPWPAAWRPI